MQALSGSSILECCACCIICGHHVAVAVWTSLSAKVLNLYQLCHSAARSRLKNNIRLHSTQSPRLVPRGTMKQAFISRERFMNPSSPSRSRYARTSPFVDPDFASSSLVLAARSFHPPPNGCYATKRTVSTAHACCHSADHTRCRSARFPHINERYICAV
jgi:hypothetical protein